MRLHSIAQAACLIAVFGFSGVQARADEYAFSYYTGGAILAPGEFLQTVAAGVLTTTNTDEPGVQLITAISGARTFNYFMGFYLPVPETDLIVSLYPPGTTNNDNLLYADSSTYLDQQGFAYQLSCTVGCGSNNDGYVQVAGYDGDYFEVGSTASNGLFGSSFTLALIPEPSSFTLAGVALLAAVGLLKGKRRT